MKTICKLGDVIELNYGKSLPQRNRTYGEIPVYGSGGIDGFHNEHLVKGPGIIVGRKGSVGNVHWEKDHFFPIDTTYYVQIKDKTNTNIKFIYYLLKTLNLKSLNTDAAVPGLNRNNALRIPIKKLPKQLQEKIISFLSPYDDLIENNSRRIQLLEQAAHLIYEEWFIRFRFPGHKEIKIMNGLPENWIRTTLGEVLTLRYGKALKAEERHDGFIQVYGSSGVVGLHNQPLVKGPGIILGRKGNVGSVYWSENDFYPIDTVYYIDSSCCNRYIFYCLKQMTFQSNDTAVPGLNRDYAHHKEINLPLKSIILKFQDTTKVLFDQISVLQKQNYKLTEARDLLIPKLISGEIVL